MYDDEIELEVKQEKEQNVAILEKENKSEPNVNILEVEEELEILLETESLDEIMVEVTEGAKETEVDVNEENLFQMASNYDFLSNKPRIEGVELQGNKTLQDLSIEALTNIELERLINSQV